MADSDDTTRAPLSRRELLLTAPALAAPGLTVAGVDTAAPCGGGAHALLDDLLPALTLPMDDPRFDAAEAAFDVARRRLYALKPTCLGDAVAKLLTVAAAGGESLPPEDVGMIADAVDFLTTGAPHLRHPALVAEAVRHGCRVYAGGLASG